MLTGLVEPTLTHAFVVAFQYERVPVPVEVAVVVPDFVYVVRLPTNFQVLLWMNWN